MDLSQRYEHARRSTSFAVRQAFLADFPLEGATRFIRSIDYRPLQTVLSYKDGEKAKPQMVLKPAVSSMLGILNVRQTIVVFPQAFVMHETLDDFKSSLIDHEGFHAMENFVQPSLLYENIPPDLLRKIRHFPPLIVEPDLEYPSFSKALAATELRAYYNQAQKACSRKLSPAYLELIHDNLAASRERLSYLMF